MKNLAIIPARGGSQRIPGKNIRPFHGKPIIAYSIETAKASGLFERVLVSSDDHEILRVAESYGADTIDRSAAMARDEVGTQEVAAYVLAQLGYRDVLGPAFTCVIYPTCPMLLVSDLQRGLKALQDDPHKMYAFAVAQEPFQPAGMFYWGRTHAYLNPLIHLVDVYSLVVPVPAERAIDINVEADWVRAERVFADLQEKAA